MAVNTAQRRLLQEHRVLTNNPPAKNKPLPIHTYLPPIQTTPMGQFYCCGAHDYPAMEVYHRVQLPPEALTVARVPQKQLSKPVYGIHRILSDATRVDVLTDIWTNITAQNPMFRLTSARPLTQQIINEIETRNAANASRACTLPAQAHEWSDLPSRLLQEVNLGYVHLQSRSHSQSRWHTTFLGHLLDYTGPPLDNNHLPWPARKIAAMMQKTLSTGPISMALYDTNPENVDCLERIWAGFGTEVDEYRLIGTIQKSKEVVERLSTMNKAGPVEAGHRERMRRWSTREWEDIAEELWRGLLVTPRVIEVQLLESGGALGIEVGAEPRWNTVIVDDLL